MYIYIYYVMYICIKVQVLSVLLLGSSIQISDRSQTDLRQISDRSLVSEFRVWA